LKSPLGLELPAADAEAEAEMIILLFHDTLLGNLKIETEFEL
jgi:hypothetical protein